MTIKKSTLKSIFLVSIGIIILLFVLANSASNDSNNNTQSENNNVVVKIEGNKQVLDLRVRGGYSPNVINAKANTPSILRMTTQNSFDCSTAVVISKLQYRTNLPYTGTTDLEIPAQPAGTTIDGNCSMGMYFFKIVFK